MIDTEKYEGHTPMWYLDGTKGVWRIESDFATHDSRVVAILLTQYEADAQLIADAPELLIEVKKLREQLRLAKEWVVNQYPNCLTTMDIFTEYIGDEEE